MQEYTRDSRCEQLGVLIDRPPLQASNYIAIHPGRRYITELGEAEFGVMAPVNETTRRALKLPENTIALIEWNNGDERHWESEIRAVTADEQALVVSQATSTLLDRIIEHYARTPADDRHPAYAVYQEWERRKQQAEHRQANSQTPVCGA